MCVLCAVLRILGSSPIAFGENPKSLTTFKSIFESSLQPWWLRCQFRSALTCSIPSGVRRSSSFVPILVVWRQAKPCLASAKYGTVHEFWKESNYSFFLDSRGVARLLEFCQKLNTEIESLPLKGWSFIWMATLLRIFCISDATSLSYLCKFWIRQEKRHSTAVWYLLFTGTRIIRPDSEWSCLCVGDIEERW